MLKHRDIPSLDELRKLHFDHKSVAKKPEKLDKLEEFALWITTHVGSMGFFLIIIIWTIIWLGWNTLGPKNLQFDPFPGFVLWLFISNMIQLSLLPLIMIGQNLQNRDSEKRAELDYEINKKAEKEVETIIAHLENQNGILQEIISKLENK